MPINEKKKYEVCFSSKVPSADQGFLVRPGRRGDIKEIVEVCTTSTSDERVAGFGTPIAGSPFADSGRLSASWQDPNRVGSAEVLVAEVNGQVVACVTIEDRGEELELVDIDVSGAYQGRGIGTRVIHYVEDRARVQGKRAVTLGTSRGSSGVPWQSFEWWQNRGYRVTHEEENEWTRSIGTGVREIRMRKDLL